MKEKILGKDYSLSVVFAGDKRMQTLNKKWRKKDKVADTLSFPYSKKEGEIFINANNTLKEIHFLFIHSLLHLKGLKHGKKMEKEEELYYNQIYGSRNRNGN